MRWLVSGSGLRMIGDLFQGWMKAAGLNSHLEMGNLVDVKLVEGLEVVAMATKLLITNLMEAED